MVAQMDDLHWALEGRSIHFLILLVVAFSTINNNIFLEHLLGLQAQFHSFLSEQFGQLFGRGSQAHNSSQFNTLSHFIQCYMRLLGEVIHQISVRHHQYVDETQLCIIILGQGRDAVEFFIWFLEAVRKWTGKTELNSVLLR